MESPGVYFIKKESGKPHKIRLRDSESIFDINRRHMMFTWIMENVATIIISGILILAVAAVIVHMVRSRRKGKSSCGCGCSGCAMNGTCHPKEQE